MQPARGDARRYLVFALYHSAGESMTFLSFRRPMCAFFFWV